MLADMEDCKKTLHTLKYEKIAVEKSLQKVSREYESVNRKFQTLSEFYPAYEQMVKTWPEDEVTGLEDRIRGSRSAFESRLKSINAEIARLENLYQKELIFKKDVSELHPQKWIDDIEKEREALYSRRSDLARILASLEVEHELLLNRKIAPARIFRDAFELIPSDIKWKSLYSFIIDYNIDNKTTERYLSLFSSFLFAPVVSSTNDAALLLELFEKGFIVEKAFTDNTSVGSAGHDGAQVTAIDKPGRLVGSAGYDGEPLPVPVFLENELVTFFRDTPAEELFVCDKTHVVSHLFTGRKNEIIECILDPEAIVRKRIAIQERIELTRGEISSIQVRLDEIAPDSEVITLAFQAIESIEKGAGEAIEVAKKDATDLLSQKSLFEEKYPESAYSIFREAEQFHKKGGIRVWEELQESVKSLGEQREKLKADERELADRSARMEDEHKKSKRLFYDHKGKYDTQKSELLSLIQFNSSGGPEKYTRLFEAVRFKTMELEEFEAERDREMETEGRLAKERELAEEHFTDTMTANVPVKQSLKEIILFVNSNDFGFMSKAGEKIEKIREKIATINKKLNFRLDEAQRFVDHLATSESGEKERIEEINHLLQKSRMKMDELNKKKQFLIDQQTDLSIASPQYDRILCHIVSHFNTPGIQYKKAVPKGFEFPESLATKVDRLYQLGGIGEIVSEKSRGDKLSSFSTQEIISDIDSLNDHFDNVGIASFADKIKNMTKKIDSFRKQYRETLEKGLADPEIPFRHYEKEHLQDTMEHPEYLLKIRKTYLEIYNREKANYERVAKTEEALRQGLAKDLTRLTDKAHDNFIILRKILKHYRKSSGASFDVRVTIAGRDNIEEAIEGLIKTIKSRHELYISNDSEVIKKSPSRLKRDDREYYGDLRTLISRDCYRQIFLNPEIRFIHPEIRNGVPTIFVNDGSISNGQKSALALLWVVALADFAVQRKLHEDRSRGVRHQDGSRVSSFLLIDGLFSQLSDENLISLSMKSLPDTEGNFQIIGFIHSPTYVHQHDFKVFPVLIQGVQHQQIEGGRKVKWVSLEKQSTTQGQMFMKVMVTRRNE
ncbi:hypothetical protein MTBBW1_2380035 [Desulfamplus magnetovallimortis]|uniref:Uncharacterized protein n=1 Tax=Desulfamplus magnetovallimortis TaxID=1246637 RepID=A0A1W1HDY6_9BACT|nr:hypothetical protein MTBBW1_2380035 [Desulfamplus magnetovallimortis]